MPSCPASSFTPVTSFPAQGSLHGEVHQQSTSIICNSNVITTVARKQGKFNLLYANVRSIRQCFGELCSLCEKHTPSFVCLTETFLSNDNDNEITPPGYLIASRRDRNHHGGGVIIFVKYGMPDIFEIPTEQLAVDGVAEIVAVRFRQNLIVCCYRRPSQDDLQIFSRLSSFIGSHVGLKLVLVGDFNVHHQQWLGSSHTSSAGEEAKDFCDSFGLEQIVDFGTRNNAVLDLCMTSLDGSVEKLPNLNKSDHATLFVSLGEYTYEDTGINNRRVVHWSKAPWHRLKHSFKTGGNWDMSGSVDDATERTTSRIVATTAMLVPSSLPKFRRKAVWWNRHCENAHRTKSRVFASGSGSLFRHATAKAHAVYCRAIRQHRVKIQQKIASSPTERTLWQVDRQLNPRKSHRVIPPVDSLADLFEIKLNRQISSSSIPSADISPINSLSQFRVKLSKIRLALKNLDPLKSVGDDNISPRVLRECYNELAGPICSLFRKITLSGKYPEKWKLARVTPVHKKGTYSDCSNFRPVAVLPTLALLFERVLSSQLHKVLDPHIPNEQYGFVKGSGCVDAGVVISGSLLRQLNNKKEAKVVAVDISAAFDSVQWPILLNDLSAAGLRGKAFSLLQSYFENRYFHVVHNGKSSSSRKTSCGTPQGGVWSPLFFNFYIRKIASIAKSCLVVQYADDLTLIMLIDTKNDRLDKIRLLGEELDLLCTFGRERGLNFEPSKTSALTVSWKADAGSMPPVVMNGSDIVDSSMLNILGFSFDSKCSFGGMVEARLKKAKTALGAISRNRDFFGSVGIATLYKSVVRTKLEYGCLLYMGAADTHLARFDRLQERAESMTGFSFQPLRARRHAAAIGLACKQLDGVARGTLQELKPSVEIPAVRRSSRLQPGISAQRSLFLQVPVATMSVFQRSYESVVPKVWNTLPLELRQEARDAGFVKTSKKLQRAAMSVNI
jgi:hypothetical protein